MNVVGVEVVAKALAAAEAEGTRLGKELSGLFESTSSPGVVDVVDAASAFATTEEKQQLAQHVVDTFADLLARVPHS